MQAGAAWPKLKPFVLELLTTLVGKQVRAGRRGGTVWPSVSGSACSGLWACMGGLRCAVYATVLAGRTLRRGHQASHKHNMPFINPSHNGQTRYEYCSEVHLLVLAIVRPLPRYIPSSVVKGVNRSV